MNTEQPRRLLTRLEEELEQLTYKATDPLEKLSSALKLTRDALSKLKEMLIQNPFATEQEEIHFFKHIKPNFYRWQIYHAALYTIEENIPVADSEKALLFLEKELSYVDRFFLQYPFQHQYYKLGALELDHLYFLRGKDSGSILFAGLPEPDPDFSTGMDYLFSKFKAFELLREWLLERLVLLRQNPLIDIMAAGKTGELRWTGDTVNLAELGYGLYYTAQINNGSAGISQIFKWLEEKFGVKIGIPAKRLGAIRSRKRLSRTKFLDEMKDSIIRRLDKEDEYDPGRGS